MSQLTTTICVPNRAPTEKPVIHFTLRQSWDQETCAYITQDVTHEFVHELREAIDKMESLMAAREKFIRVEARLKAAMEAEEVE